MTTAGGHLPSSGPLPVPLPPLLAFFLRRVSAAAGAAAAALAVALAGQRRPGRRGRAAEWEGSRARPLLALLCVCVRLCERMCCLLPGLRRACCCETVQETQSELENLTQTEREGEGARERERRRE